MPRLPLEDTYVDVMRKALAGLALPLEEVARRAEVPPEDAQAVLDGRFNEVVARRMARHLRLHPDALCKLASGSWYPRTPVFPAGFAAFSSRHGEMNVNSYLIWDERSRQAAAFDTGGDCTEMLEVLQSLKASLRYLFLTHTHPDHVADLERLVSATGTEVWASELEPAPYPSGRTFKENAFFHIGPFGIKCLSTPGHSVGGTTYYVTGLSYPLAVVGDAIFSCSMGRGNISHRDAVDGVVKKILTLPASTVLACGHGPLSTVGQERKHNPFFIYR
ncbi:MAG: MBL fold metallo-hydrolase [Opitutaceae bacterium]|nr:MBL fold metallo-hydrolase [Opitutaceae bacterium]